jgi:hypothetical protein
MNKLYAVVGAVLLIASSTGIALATPVAAPEIDAASAGSAIALVSGILLLARARRK